MSTVQRVLAVFFAAVVVILGIGISAEASAPTAKRPTPTSKPTRTKTPMPTPSVSVSPTATPTVSVTPSPTPTVSATPSPTPTVSVTATPTPAPTSFPDASNTGVPAGTALISVAELRINTGGTASAPVVYSGYDIQGVLVINAPYVTVENSRVRGYGENDWVVILNSHSTLRNVEVGGGLDGVTYGHATGIVTSDPSNLMERINVHHQISGIRFEGGTIKDSYIHDMPMGDPVYNWATGTYNTNDHSGGLMTTRGNGMVLDHSTVSGGNSADIFVQRDVTEPNTATVGPYTIKNSLFKCPIRNGQVPSFGINIENKQPGTNGPFVVNNNTFERGWEVAPIGAELSQATVYNNRYTDGTPM
jgi:hypothetical protein